MAEFTGKVALVTGATSGIGRATALAFAREGAHLIVAGRSEERGGKVARTIANEGGKAIFIQAEISDPADVEALVSTTLDAFGRLDCAVNNAGTGEGMGTPLAETDLESFDRQIAVNLRGVFLCMKHEIPPMLRQGSGVIVNVSSVQGLVAGVRSSAYTAAKHGVLGLTKSAALEYVQQGIRINAVCPGAIRTPMLEKGAFEIVAPGEPEKAEALYRQHIPAGRIASPEEIASVILWLCSDAASYMVGQAVTPDGGYTAM